MCWVLVAGHGLFIAAHRLSVVVTSSGYSLVAVHGLLVAVASFFFFCGAYEIKRCLLLGRKAMTNLDSILKNRNITLPTKVHLVKPMVFLVVMHGCESWTIKKLSAEELMLLNYGVGEDS